MPATIFDICAFSFETSAWAEATCRVASPIWSSSWYSWARLEAAGSQRRGMPKGSEGLWL
ncbi:MAG: hypothetical protein ACRDV8_05310 [Acidimicrobiales bacterium]